MLNYFADTPYALGPNGQEQSFSGPAGSVLPGAASVLPGAASQSPMRKSLSKAMTSTAKTLPSPTLNTTHGGRQGKQLDTQNRKRRDKGTNSGVIGGTTESARSSPETPTNSKKSKTSLANQEDSSSSDEADESSDHGDGEVGASDPDQASLDDEGSGDHDDLGGGDDHEPNDEVFPPKTVKTPVRMYGSQPAGRMTTATPFKGTGSVQSKAAGVAQPQAEQKAMSSPQPRSRKTQDARKSKKALQGQPVTPSRAVFSDDAVQVLESVIDQLEATPELYKRGRYTDYASLLKMPECEELIQDGYSEDTLKNKIKTMRRLRKERADKN